MKRVVGITLCSIVVVFGVAQPAPDSFELKNARAFITRGGIAGKVRWYSCWLSYRRPKHFYSTIWIERRRCEFANIIELPRIGYSSGRGCVAGWTRLGVECRWCDNASRAACSRRRSNMPAGTVCARSHPHDLRDLWETLSVRSLIRV